jgi:hypothetical protein
MRGWICGADAFGMILYCYSLLFHNYEKQSLKSKHHENDKIEYFRIRIIILNGSVGANDYAIKQYTIKQHAVEHDFTVIHYNARQHNTTENSSGKHCAAIDITGINAARQHNATWNKHFVAIDDNRSGLNNTPVNCSTGNCARQNYATRQHNNIAVKHDTDDNNSWKHHTAFIRHGS